MKKCLSAFLLFLCFSAMAQQKLEPGKNQLEQQWIRPDSYKMKWLMQRDSSSMEIGEVVTTLMLDKKHLTIITSVNMKNARQPWIDTTIADSKTLKPVYHSSYNAQRDMALHFGKIVTGYYLDKVKQSTTLISDTTRSPYFDSNLYPALLRWLPLADGYTCTIPIYDHNPSGKTGILTARVKQVISGTIKTSSGTHTVWILTVSDDIGGDEASQIYYIDKQDRRLWKQTIHAGGRKMEMVLVE